MEDDHVEPLAKQEMLGLAAVALDRDLATARAERAIESIGVLGQNQDAHTGRVSPGERQRPGVRAPQALRQLLTAAQALLSLIRNHGKR